MSYNKPVSTNILKSKELSTPIKQSINNSDGMSFIFYILLMFLSGFMILLLIFLIHFIFLDRGLVAILIRVDHNIVTLPATTSIV